VVKVGSGPQQLQKLRRSGIVDRVEMKISRGLFAVDVETGRESTLPANDG